MIFFGASVHDRKLGINAPVWKTLFDACVLARVDGERKKMTLSFTIDSMRRKSSKLWICTCAAFAHQWWIVTCECECVCERYLLKMNDKLCVINVCSRVVWRVRCPLSCVSVEHWICALWLWISDIIFVASNAVWASWAHIFGSILSDSFRIVFFFFIRYVRLVFLLSLSVCCCGFILNILLFVPLEIDG